MDSILLVEDDDSISECVAMVLEDDYHVVVASNGLEALEQMRLHPGRFKVMLLDVIMPELGGEGVISAMGRMNLFVPTIVMSASRCPASLNHLPYISKPFDLADLQARIAAVVRGGDREPQEASL